MMFTEIDVGSPDNSLSPPPHMIKCPPLATRFTPFIQLAFGNANITTAYATSSVLLPGRQYPCTYFFLLPSRTKYENTLSHEARF
jgi:hypothetical protein